MNTLKLHSKLIDLQGQIISTLEGDKMISQLRRILNLRSTGQINDTETGSRIRQASWKIAEDLQLNELALSSGSNESILAGLPGLLKAAT